MMNEDNNTLTAEQLEEDDSLVLTLLDEEGNPFNCTYLTSFNVESLRRSYIAVIPHDVHLFRCAESADGSELFISAIETAEEMDSVRELFCSGASLMLELPESTEIALQGADGKLCHFTIISRFTAATAEHEYLALTPHIVKLYRCVENMTGDEDLSFQIYEIESDMEMDAAIEAFESLQEKN